MNRTRPYQHFLDIADLSFDDLQHILTTAKDWKELRRGKPKGAKDGDRNARALLSDYTLAMIFEKPSTRTRISFEVGMHQLGGKTLILPGETMQIGRGESIEDTAQVMSRMIDAIMIRANNHTMVEELAKNATVPVINALTDFSHPCQIMADIMTFEEHRGPIQGKKLVWFGDGNNVATSFIHAAIKFDFELVLACPPDFMPNPDVLNWAKSHNGRITVTNNPDHAAKDADCVVTDCWVSMGDKNAELRHKALAPYQVTQQVMDQAKSTAVFMHCLPAHKGEEVTAEVIDGPRSIVFDEAENRLHVQKAIIAWCLGKI